MERRLLVAIVCAGMIVGALLSQADELFSFADEQKDSGTWINLLEGDKLDQWTYGNGKPVTKGWMVKDGELYRNEQAGSIFTKKEYDDFILELEWKVAKASNSGIKYRVKKYGKSLLGPEYQILDDKNHPDAKRGTSGSRQAAALYDILPCNDQKKLKLVGEYNKTRIVVKGSHFEHWLNGKKVLEIDTKSEEFKKAIEKSKFKNTEGFAQNSKGLIMLQDHNDPVWFKNIRIKELK